MSLWWLWGDGAVTSTSVAEANHPSLWSGGITWEDADAGTGTQGYWQTSASPTARTGVPHVSLAVAGEGIRHTVHRVSWQLGRGEWLASLQPSSASFEVEGVVTFSVMDPVVIALMSDTTDQHSDPLWVGYVDTINETTETSGRVTTSVSCVDVIGRLGQAPAPEDDIASYLNATLADYLEYIAAEAGTHLVAVDDSGLGVVAVSLFSFVAGETALAAINRLEHQENANVFLRGDGRLVVQRRYYESEPDRDPAPTPVTLSGVDAPAQWTTQVSPTNVVNDWGYPLTAAQEASVEAYGRRVGSPEDNAAWDALIQDTGALMLSPRKLLTSADVPITDLGHPALTLQPNDWVTIGGVTYQVLSVSHSVEPGDHWQTSITGDTTQVALHEAFA